MLQDGRSTRRMGARRGVWIFGALAIVAVTGCTAGTASSSRTTTSTAPATTSTAPATTSTAPQSSDPAAAYGAAYNTWLARYDADSTKVDKNINSHPTTAQTAINDQIAAVHAFLVAIATINFPNTYLGDVAALRRAVESLVTDLKPLADNAIGSTSAYNAANDQVQKDQQTFTDADAALSKDLGL
jgi:hypothetical protein